MTTEDDFFVCVNTILVSLKSIPINIALIKQHTPLLPPVFTISRININSNKIKSNKPTKVRDFSDNNILNVKIHMAKINWHDLLKLFDNDSHAYDKFIEIFTDLLDKYTALKRKKKSKTKSSLPWIKKRLNKNDKKNRLYKQYTNRRNHHNKTKYKTLNNKVNKLVRSAKKNYFSNQLEKEKTNIKKHLEDIE